MKLLLSGASGFIGTSLIKHLLDSGHQVTLLSRNVSALQNQKSQQFQIFQWDGCTSGAWTQSLLHADAVINLAGENIAAKRWSASQKQKILESRIQSTAVLIRALEKASPRPKIFINASAVGYYGHVSSEEVTEEAVSGKGFLAEVCRQWEETALKAKPLGVRVVLLRTGIVLGKDGGALSKMLQPFQFFVGGPLGNGNQWFPWIHLEDELRMILFALENSAIEGPLNLTAPNPVTMNEFCRMLGKVLHRPSWARVPSFALRILLGEMSTLLLEGQRAVPQKSLHHGFKFIFSDLESALSDLLKEHS